MRLLGLLGQAFDELVVDLLLDEQPAAGRAALAAVEVDGVEGAVDGRHRGRRRRRRRWGSCRPARTCVRLSVSAAAFWMILAVSTWPVKAILSTSGWATRAAPVVSPMPLTTLITPAGKPASRASSAIRRAVSGVCSAGFMHDGVAAGQGRAPLPGQHQQREVPGDDLADHADRLPQRVRQEAAAHRDGPALDLVGPAGVVAQGVDDALPCRPCESVIVLPQLSDSRAASSSAFFSTRSASLKSSRPRSAASIVLQGPDSRACRAALTALSTSAAPGRRDLGDHLAGRRVVRLELTAIDRVDPLVVDEQLGLLDGRGRGPFQRRLRHDSDLVFVREGYASAGKSCDGMIGRSMPGQAQPATLRLQPAATPPTLTIAEIGQTGLRTQLAQRASEGGQSQLAQRASEGRQSTLAGASG